MRRARQRHQVVVSALFELTHWKLRRVGEGRGRQGKGSRAGSQGRPLPPTIFSPSLPLSPLLVNGTTN